MAPVVEEIGENRVRLTVDVPAHDVHHAVEHAATDLAASVKIPGFRKGKVPMPVLVSRIGRDRLLSEAVESHIGAWFWTAASSTRVRPVEQPEYEYELPSSENEDWRFTATFAVQPKPELPDWTALEVGTPEPVVPPEVVDAELESLQRLTAELVPVEGRSAQPGDTLVIDLEDGAGQAQRDYVVELGTGRLVEELEEGLVGMPVGVAKELTYELADGSSRTVTATLNELKTKVLPPLDDELARSVSEFEALDDLRADVESALREQLADELEGQFRSDVVDALVRASNVDTAGALVESRTRELLRGLVRSLERRGIDPSVYLAMTGQTAEQLEERMRAEAEQSVARELVLEAAAEQLGIEVTDAEIDDLIRRQAEEIGDDPDEALAEVEASGARERLREDLRLRGALDRIASEVKRIPSDLAAAREKLWTPEQEKKPGDSKLWTPGSKETP